ncbi:MAG: InlB B-repeat-containing protein [Treponema sp.]|nr:InlB B-repeat-containing protein [Treponema sp.]
MKKAFVGLFVILSLAVISCPNGDNLNGNNLIEHTVTFKNGDVIIDIIQVPVNTKIPSSEVPANPTKDGHDFDGWDFDIENDDITEDTTINAQWEIKKFTITFNVDGDETTIDNVEWGTVFNTLNIPTPEKANHNFTGWLPAFPTTVIASGTYTAQFNEMTSLEGPIYWGSLTLGAIENLYGVNQAAVLNANLRDDLDEPSLTRNGIFLGTISKTEGKITQIIGLDGAHAVYITPKNLGEITGLINAVSNNELGDYTRRDTYLTINGNAFIVYVRNNPHVGANNYALRVIY